MLAGAVLFRIALIEVRDKRRRMAGEVDSQPNQANRTIKQFYVEGENLL
jgi:hypothetical protein